MVALQKAEVFFGVRRLGGAFAGAIGVTSQGAKSGVKPPHSKTKGPNHFLLGETMIRAFKPADVS